MALLNEHPTENAIAGTVVDAPPRRYPSWLGSDGDFDPKHLHWVSNYRDWQDIKVDVLNLPKRLLDLFKRRFRP
jgi:hypothetical protein